MFYFLILFLTSKKIIRLNIRNALIGSEQSPMRYLNSIRIWQITNLPQSSAQIDNFQEGSKLTVEQIFHQQVLVVDFHLSSIALQYSLQVHRSKNSASAQLCLNNCYKDLLDFNLIILHVFILRLLVILRAKKMGEEQLLVLVLR